MTKLSHGGCMDRKSERGLGCEVYFGDESMENWDSEVIFFVKKTFLSLPFFLVLPAVLQNNNSRREYK